MQTQIGPGQRLHPELCMLHFIVTQATDSPAGLALSSEAYRARIRSAECDTV